MALDRERLLGAWDSATLDEDPVILAEQWKENLPEVREYFERAGAETLEELFAGLLLQGPPTHLYVGMLLARTALASDPRPTTKVSGGFEIESETARVYLGDLHIQGRVDNAGGALVVLGDLIIDGVYVDKTRPDAMVVVGGNMRAKGISTEGWLDVRGDLVVSAVLHGHDNDCSMAVGRTLRTRLFLDEEHFFECGRLDAGHYFHLTREGEGENKRLLKRILADGLVADDDGNPGFVRIDAPEIMTRLIDGSPVFLPGA
jgi:hypothetical protein